MKGPWEDKYDDIAQDGIEPTDDMVNEALEDDRRDSYDEDDTD